MPKRRVLLVDDEVPVLLTMKAVLEISGFDVDTATSARDGRLKIRKNEYEMIITDMRMESETAGREVIQAARTAHYHPAVALLTAFPVDEEDWQEMGANEMLVKATRTQELLRKLEQLLTNHAARLQKAAVSVADSGKQLGKPKKVKHAVEAGSAYEAAVEASTGATAETAATPEAAEPEPKAKETKSAGKEKLASKPKKAK
jgi:DNA-binding response OmpR family regulator